MSHPIELRSLGCRVAGRAVLSEVSLALDPGETLAVLGPSGAGKSTLLRAILGLVPPATGEILIAGRLASSAGRIAVPPEDRGLGMVFQDLALWPHLTCAGNLAFVLRPRDLDRPAERRAIAAALESVGLAGFEDRYPGSLSGGERQRVAIARALVASPAAVLLDEPLANLDIALRAELVSLFDTVLRGAKVASLHITHDPRDAARLADRVAILEAGRLTQIGTPAEIAALPASPFARAVAAAWGS